MLLSSQSFVVSLQSNSRNQETMAKQKTVGVRVTLQNSSCVHFHKIW